MSQIIYNRGTTYSLTHLYTAPIYFGSTLYFTVKNVEYDADTTDITNSIMTPKTATMTGSSFPQTTIVTILPTDIADTVPPQDYFYSLKVKDSTGAEYLADSGTFTLNASTTNRT